MTMAIDSGTPIASMTIRFDPISKQPFKLRFTTDEDEPQNGYIAWELSLPGQLSAGEDLLTALRAHWTANGRSFVDRDGNAIRVSTTDISSLPGADTYLADLPIGYYHPFDQEVVAAPELQESVTSLGTRTYSVRLWKRTNINAVALPADWYDEETGIVADSELDGWKHSWTAANAAGNADHPMRFVLSRVAIAPDGTKTYQPWEIFTEFGVEYSADGVSWHDAPQQEGDTFFSFLNPDGVRRVVEIAAPPDVGWTQLYSGTPYLRTGSHYQDSLGGTINLNLYERLRFRLQPFGRWESNDEPDEIGGEAHAILHRPIGGWEFATDENNDANVGTLTWRFHELEGLTVQAHESGSRGQVSIPASETRSSAPDPAIALAGKMKFIAPAAAALHEVDRLRMFSFGSGSGYQRFRLTIFGATF